MRLSLFRETLKLNIEAEENQYNYCDYSIYSYCDLYITR